MNYYARAKGSVIERILEHAQATGTIANASAVSDRAPLQQVALGYARDTSAWEEWQLEYRYGALYIFPPADIAEAVPHGVWTVP